MEETRTDRSFINMYRLNITIVYLGSGERTIINLENNYFINNFLTKEIYIQNRTSNSENLYRASQVMKRQLLLSKALDVYHFFQ